MVEHYTKQPAIQSITLPVLLIFQYQIQQCYCIILAAQRIWHGNITHRLQQHQLQAILIYPVLTKQLQLQCKNMKSFKNFMDEKSRCWPGYKPVPGKTAYSPGSCKKEDHVKTPDDCIKQKKLNEDLRKWFKQKWVRMDTKGNIKGDCAREPGEGKPKCLPQAKAHAIGKDARASAAQRKRREDPNPERRGAPINVRTEMKTLKQFLEEIENLEEKNVPTSPEKWAQAISAAKSKFAVYPSAYANGWASKKYKSMGGGWKSVSEESQQVDENHIAISMGRMLDDEGSMVLNQLDDIERCSKMIRDYVGKDYEKQMPAWVQSKVTLAADYINTVGTYLSTKNQSVDEMFDIIEGLFTEIAEANDIDPEVIWEDFEDVSDEELFETAAWRRKEGKDPEGGLNRKGIASYRKENPGSKLSMAVTTPPSKLKPGSKAANRRKSFCARMGGMKGPMRKDGKPTRKALALRKWNC